MMFSILKLITSSLKFQVIELEYGNDNILLLGNSKISNYAFTENK